VAASRRSAGPERLSAQTLRRHAAADFCSSPDGKSDRPALAQTRDGRSAKSYWAIGNFPMRPRQDLRVGSRPIRPRSATRSNSTRLPETVSAGERCRSWNFPGKRPFASTQRQGKALVNLASRSAATKRRPRASACCSAESRDAAPPPSRQVNWPRNWAIMRGDGPPICHARRWRQPLPKDGYRPDGEPGLRCGNRQAQF